MNKNNEQAVKDFLSMYEDETAKEMSKFLFQLQGVFFRQPGIDLTDKFKDSSAMHFDMLFTLVNSLQPVK